MSKGSKKNESGSFGSGFLLGVFAGATAHFLAKTTEGKKLAQTAVQQWSSVREYLEEKTNTQEKGTAQESLVEQFYKFRHLVTVWAEGELVAVQKKQRKEKKQAAKENSQSTQKKKLFKGV